MLKHNEANPLSVHQLRRMDHCPPHFTFVHFNLSTVEKNITDWIWENFEGRFYIGDHFTEEQNNSFSMQKIAAFEIPGEASYFALILNTINTYEQN